MISYSSGARCILEYTYDLHEPAILCRRKFVRSTILSPHTNGVTKIFSEVNGPINTSFECSGELASCGCCHSEIKVIQKLLQSAPHPMFQYILLCSFSPCTQCTNAIIHSEIIDAVIYDKITEHDLRGEERLAKVMPVVTIKRIEEITNGAHRAELCFIKRWSI